MNEPFVENKTKKLNVFKISIIIFSSILILSLISLGLYIHYIYYNQIVSVKNISERVTVNDKVVLPKTIEAHLRNGKKIGALVKWQTDKIDTSSKKKMNVIGTVKGYDNFAVLSVDVYRSVVSINQLNRVIIQNDKLDVSQLPTSLETKYNDDIVIKENVKWDLSNFDTSKLGEYNIKGKIDSDDDPDTKIQAIYDITIISKKEAFNEILVKNKLSDKPLVINAMQLVEDKVPDKFIYNLFNMNIKIEFTSDKIESDNEYNPSGLASGVFIPEEHKIQICYDQDEQYGLGETLLHEIGHTVDFTYTQNGFKCSIADGNDKFMNIYKSEASNLFNPSNFYGVSQSDLDYYVKQPEEYFAECFSLYYFNEDTKKILKEKAPQTYDYIQSIL
ncbi:MAG: Ig-like domain-containing protein [Bacillota bacterium]|nr:Ig-like domain-containing protein [Bacillota bacterium]